MTCSKLFSGSLPELINEIIQYFHYDYKTLYSCILVNRLWCRLAIPLLWKDPFSIKFPKSYHFIEMYLYNLNDDNKAKLNEYVIYNDLFPSNTIFNYSRFIQRLNTFQVCYSVEKWIATVRFSATEEQNSRYFMRIANLSHSQISNFTKLVYRLLFLTFIENEVNLHSLEITMFEYFDVTCELILQNPNFIHNIKNLTLDLDEVTGNITKFSEFLCYNCNSISSLYLLFPLYVDNYPTERSLSQIVNSQKNLKKILLGYSEFPLYHLLLLLKNPNCSNTLNTIIFYCVDFKNIIVLDEVFNQLNVLESIHIAYCYSLDSKFIQQINNINKPFKLKSLFLDEILHIESIELLIQKSGGYLENFGSINESQLLVQLFESVKKCCNKIKFLYLVAGLNDQNINLVFSLIENIKQNLNYLFIETLNVELSSIILQKLGQVLPFKLEYLSLHLSINTSDFEMFLKNSQNTFIKILLIRNKKKEESESIFPYLKEYIMKKKRVKHLAILETFSSKGENLFYLKDKVKEFELYDIQVLNYNDLSINIYDFINNNYLFM
ncbi:hypothetical protein RclHR1_13210006 [Rhizophagus clarus]|uniref:F-box domain-containing protein n=1 Tax=Rhizophagus clarus TaxID=94130 RepID=A0A2Z6QLW9_9GLOM|nr:hypothetical protein RclHR1_13210006 [Rhizophagus clarus]